jgi:hypothetical protein
VFIYLRCFREYIPSNTSVQRKNRLKVKQATWKRKIPRKLLPAGLKILSGNTIFPESPWISGKNCENNENYVLAASGRFNVIILWIERGK